MTLKKLYVNNRIKKKEILSCISKSVINLLKIKEYIERPDGLGLCVARWLPVGYALDANA
jgi:hypothetical protein